MAPYTVIAQHSSICIDVRSVRGFPHGQRKECAYVCRCEIAFVTTPTGAGEHSYFCVDVKSLTRLPPRLGEMAHVCI